MRKSIPFAGIIILLLVFCSDSPTSGPSEQDPDYVIVDTVIIGNSGGTIEAEDFKLTVPPGAFNLPVKLELSASSDDRPFGEYSNSRTFKIGNFPAQFNQPLEVKVKYNSPITGDALLAMREVSVSSTTDTIGTAFRLAAARAADGYLIHQIQPPNITKSGLYKYLDDKPWYVYFNATWGFNKDTTVDKHFAVAYPSVINENKAEELGGYLEEAYKKFESMNFNYSSRTYWPMDVTIKKPTWHDYPMKETTRGLYRHGFGINWGSFTFHQDTVLTNSPEQLRTLAGHEFFHFVQYMYYYDWPLTLNDKYIWISEASSTWSEHLFTTNINYIPSVRKHNWAAPLLGAEYGAGFTGIVDENEKKPWNAKRHGYGMSALIKYLVSKYGENVIIRIWNKIAVNLEVMAAIIDIIPEADKATWWDDFLREYVLGNIYSDFHAADHALGYAIQTTDKPIINSDQLPDLSGRLILIPLNFQNIQADTEIRFSVSDPSTKITVFEFRRLSIQGVLEGPDRNVTITNVKSLKDNGAELIVLISNSRAVSPYTDLTQTDFKIEVGSTSFFPYNQCSFAFRVKGLFNRTNHPIDFTSFWGVYPEVDGTYQNGQFTGRYEYKSNGDEEVHDLTINFGNNGYSVTSFSLTGHRKERQTQYPDEEYYSTSKWTVKSGQQDLVSGNTKYFVENYASVADYINSDSLEYEISWYEWDGTKVTETFLQPIWDDMAMLEIHLEEN